MVTVSRSMVQVDSDLPPYETCLSENPNSAHLSGHFPISWSSKYNKSEQNWSLANLQKRHFSNWLQIWQMK